MAEQRRQRRDRDGGYSDLQERVVEINRVAKVVKGGRRFSFTALVGVGDEKSQVGVGYGKANEVPLAIQKAVERAKKNLFKVPMHGTTITHQTLGVYGAGRELAGIRDVLSKSLGSQNPINLVKATMTALQELRSPDEVAKLRGLSIGEVLGTRGPNGDAQASAPDAGDGAEDAPAAGPDDEHAAGQTAEPVAEAGN